MSRWLDKEDSMLVILNTIFKKMFSGLNYTDKVLCKKLYQKFSQKIRESI
jgi:hypothetical protein